MSDQSSVVVTAKPDGPWMVNALKPGHSILEYEVERTLGGGGFGITYLARDANLDLPVAVKEYLPSDLAMRATDGSVQALGDSSKDQFQWGLERFLSEARVLASFRHPNIVRALRYFAANGTAYIVMEFESGESLKKWLPRQSGLNESALLKLVAPLLDGLEIIHNAGYLHRDIKPDNIYIRTDNTPVLIDFGSARSTMTDRDMTSIVSPGFAPFEQYQTKGNQGPWTDLYSLAAVMYWLVTGTKPLNSIERLKQDALPPATQLVAHNLVGESVLGAIDWALNMDETKRPQTVAEFRQRLTGARGQDRTIRVTDDCQTGVSHRNVSTGFENSRPSGLGTVSADNQRNNLVCSILFLDIVAYSKTSVNEQYELKSSFNQLISGKLSHVPDSSRITLDTGDGAAICFMGDPEEVLSAAKDIQRTLEQQERLQVRMGLHIGPVRILNDLNGHNNVIGDGINVAQRVMSFADNNTLVVSRAFYDIVACLNEGDEQSFSYLGERRDKHDRIHEIYCVGSARDMETVHERTIALAHKNVSAVNHIDPDAIHHVEADLTHYLGPLAPVLIRKMAARAGNETELRNLLAQSISDQVQREEFLQGSVSRNRNNNTQRVSVESSRSIPNSGPVSALNNSGFPVSGPSATISHWLSQDTFSILEKHLAKALGPMAKVLIKKEMKKLNNCPGLCTALSLHIDNVEIRAQFLKDISQLLKSNG